MSEKHLRAGDSLPPMQEGKLRLYIMRFCPYSQRVRLVLDAKKIAYDVVNVNLTEKPEWLIEKNPLGKVPIIELEGDAGTLYESLVISDYLDEVYTDRPLHFTDPCKRAKDKIAITHFNKAIAAMCKMQFRSSSFSLNEDYLEDFFTCLEYYEKELVQRSTTFFGGDKPGMLDYMMWPWFERIDMIRDLGGEKFIIPVKRFKRLMDWRISMIEDEAVVASHLGVKYHVEYYKSFKAGNPDYDLVVEK